MSKKQSYKKLNGLQFKLQGFLSVLKKQMFISVVFILMPDVFEIYVKTCSKSIYIEQGLY